MKLKAMPFLLVLLFSIQFTNAQYQELDIKTLHFDNSKPVRIFFTALWCSPCMGKYKLVQKEFSEDTSFNNMVLIDALGFSRQKLERIAGQPFDSLRSYLLPARFYKTKGPIAVNLPRKALSRFLDELKKKYPGSNLDGFWFGDILLISPEGQVSMKKIKV